MGKRLAVLGLVAALAIMTLAGAGLAMAQTGTQATPTPTSTPWVGVSLTDLNETVAKRLNLTQTTGVAIVQVTSGSPAEKAGLKVADIVTAVDGKAVTKAADAVAAVQAKKIGDVVAFAIVRGGQSQTVNVTTAAQPAKAQSRAGGALPDMRGNGPMAGGGFFGFGDRLRGFGRGLGSLPNMKDLQSLDPAERFKQFLGQTFRYLDKDGKAVSVETVYGTVVEAKADSVTIKPNDPAKQPTTYTINADTKILVPGNATVDRLKAGDPVVVTTADGKTALSITGTFGFPSDQSNGSRQQRQPNGGTRTPGTIQRAPMAPHSGTSS